MEPFESDIQNCLRVLHLGGTLIFPADTGWVIGCDARNEHAVAKMITSTGNAGQDKPVVLGAEEREVLQWVAAPDLAVFDFVAQQKTPTTIVFEDALDFPENLLAADGSILIRLVRDTFCRHLLKRWRKPVAIYPASFTGEAAIKSFQQIPGSILNSVDYAVNWRRDEMILAQAAQVVRWKG